MKRINYYEKISKYNQDKLKLKLIWIYLSLSSIFLLSFFMISISEFSEKESVKTVYIPKKIENGKLNYEKENINIINNGTANIIINNYYGDSIIKKEKGEYIFKIYSKDIIVLNDLLKKAIFNLDNYKDNKSCKVYANSNAITNNRTSFSLEHISCENGFSEKLTGYILGEDAKREILLEKNNIDKELILGVLNGFLQLMNLNKENLNNEILENLYIISPNRKFDLIISEEILGQCGGDYKFKDGKCIIELIEDIQK